MAPLTSPVMWTVTYGDCTLLEDGCVASPNFPSWQRASGCLVSINPQWTGVLFVDYMDGSYASNLFYVDGEYVPTLWGQGNMHGMAPKNTLEWSLRGGPNTAWKLCQVTALPLSRWRVTSGKCHVDREGCFESTHLVYSDFCWADHCVVEFPGDWEGSLNVVDAHFDWDYSDHASYYFTVPPVLTVNGQSHSVSSNEDFVLTGVHGMVATGTFSWRQSADSCTGVKICPMESLKLPGPWGDDPWTCTAAGDNCELPFVFNGVSFTACTQQLSDPYDADQDGSLHNGHPQCQSATGLSLCGPCSCAAGEDQTYNMSSVYLTRGLLGLSLARHAQLDDSRALAAVALQTAASCVLLEHHRLQVQLHARIACMACSMVTKCLSVPPASLASLVLV